MATLQAKLLGSLGDKFLSAALRLALHLDLIAGDNARVGAHNALTVELKFHVESDIVAVDFAVTDSDIGALRTGHRAGERRAIRFEIVNDFTGLVVTTGNLRDPLAGYVGRGGHQGEHGGQGDDGEKVLKHDKDKAFPYWSEVTAIRVT